jgi:hypothetical protein
VRRLRNLAFLFPALTLSLSAVPLSTLLGTSQSGGLVVGDKVFYNFGYNVSCSGGAGITDCNTLVSDGLITGINPTNIQINPDTTFAGLFGFDFTSPLEAISDGTNNTTVDITLTYDAAVTAAGGTNLISDVHLMGSDVRNPNTNQNPPSVSIGESVFNLIGGGFLGNLQITDPPPSLSAAVTLSTPVASIAVLKDIRLASGAGTSGGAADFANLTSMSQLLSQVPEPRAYSAIVALFVIGLFFTNRKKRQQTE